MNLTIKGLRARRVKISRKLQEFERKRAHYIKLADNLAASCTTATEELVKIDAAIDAMASLQSHLETRPRKARGPRAKRNAALDEFIVKIVTEAGTDGITANDLYDELERRGIALQKRQSFKVHLSYLGREGPITPRHFKWMMKDIAPPLPPPAIEEAERMLLARGAMSRAELELELSERRIPYTKKSLQTQLSERLRTGRLIFNDGRYAIGQ